MNRRVIFVRRKMAHNLRIILRVFFDGIGLAVVGEGKNDIDQLINFGNVDNRFALIGLFIASVKTAILTNGWLEKWQ